MLEILLLLIFVVLLIIVGFLAYTMIEVRSTAIKMREFLIRADDQITPAISELNKTIKSIGEAADNFNAISSDVREVSSSFKNLAEDVESISSMLREIPVKVSGIRAAFDAVFGVLIKQFFKKG